MKTFTEYVSEDFETSLKMEIYKMLKKKYNKTFTHMDDEFKEEEKIDFKYKDNKFKIYINCKDYNKCVYNYEWI